MFRHCERDGRRTALPSDIPSQARARARAFVPSCTVPVKPALFELSQWRNKTSEPGDRTPLQSASAFCCSSPRLPRRRYRLFLLSLFLRIIPSCSPTRHAILRSRLAFLSGLGPQTTKLLSGVVALPRGAHFIFPFLRSHSLSLTLSFSSLHLPFSALPLPPLFAVEDAAFQIVSASRGTKGKGWQNESIVSA